MDKTRKKLRDSIKDKLGMNTTERLNRRKSVAVAAGAPAQNEQRDYIEHFVAKPPGPEKEMEELAKAGIRNLFSRQNVKRVANLPAK